MSILIAVSLVVTGGVLYFFLVFRLKDSINFIIDKESGGKYAFDASDATLSIRSKHLSLKNAVLYCKDPAGADAYYKVRIPEIYFSITSWRQLLFRKKLIVDSLAITRPDIYINVRPSDVRRAPIHFQAADILTYLEKALTHFNVHKFSLKDAAFTYQRSGASRPLHGDHINLAVSNFTVVNNEDSHLLGSDKISVLLGQQHWVLPDGRHEIGFRRMSFDSKGQRFELDSFYFRQKADAGMEEIRLYADKFFFNSRHLPAIYQKDQLLLDTLICVGPVLSIPAGGGAGEAASHELRAASGKAGEPRFRADLFKWINVGFIAVTDGRLLLQNKDGITQNTATRKANLRIYNLGVDPARNPALSTDSILLDLNNIEFVTPDSLYKLSIDEFSFLKNNAIFRNAKFGPVRPLDDASPDRSRQVTFTAPSLLLKDISIVDLMQRRLKASAVELRRPRIVLSGSPSPPSAKKMALFYQTLHNVSELIHTGDLNILDGTLNYRRSGDIPLSADVKHFDVHILPDKLFISDSLADIKHAISTLRVGGLRLTSNGTTIQASNFVFDGAHAQSLGRQLEVRTAGGLVLKADDISWDLLDWGVFQRDKSIQIRSLHAGRLSVHGEHPPAEPRVSRQPGSLPVINIGQLTVNELLFDGNTHDSRLHFTITGLKVDSLHSVQSSSGRFAWRRLQMNGSHLGLEGKKEQVHVKELRFDSEEGMVARGLEFESRSGFGHIKLSAPQLRMNAAWHSSDLSDLPVSSIISRDMKLTFFQTSPKDTVLVTAGAAFHADNINLQPSNAYLTGVLFSWNDAALGYHKDSVSFTAGGLSGSFKRDTFRLTGGVPLSWRQAIAGLTITKGDLHYKGKKITAHAGTCSWDPLDQVLRIKNFSVLPNAGREETFHKAQWQGDYIVLKGNLLTLAGVRWGHDSLLSINRLLLDGIDLEASRDKRIPFRHGIEKPMPTRLINTIPFPVEIDSIRISNSHVTYNELSAATHQWSSIPIRDINGCLVRVTNRNNARDTLELFAAARLFDGKIRHFAYKEFYGDSLSAFMASSYLSPMDLTQFSQVSVPAAAVRVVRGHADTVYSSWAGNKYATYGTMHFYYNNLKVQVLNKKDIHKGGLLPVLETWLANLILPARRQRSSAIFVQRDREKFVFNYWVKAQASGVLTTVGIKKSKKYRKRYQQIYKEYSLPVR